MLASTDLCGALTTTWGYTGDIDASLLTFGDTTTVDLTGVIAAYPGGSVFTWTNTHTNTYGATLTTNLEFTVITCNAVDVAQPDFVYVIGSASTFDLSFNENSNIDAACPDFTF